MEAGKAWILHSMMISVMAPMAATDCTKADVVFVIDKSGSIGKDNWKLQMSFIEDLVEELPISKTKTRIGSVSFGKRAIVDFHLNSYYSKNELIGAFDSIVYTEGGTNTAGGLLLANHRSFMTENGDRPDVIDICLLITDGNPNKNVEKLPGAIASLEDRGINLLVLVIGGKVNVTKLGLEHSDPRVLEIGNFSDLTSFTSSLRDLICSTAGKKASNDVFLIYAEDATTIANSYTTKDIQTSIMSEDETSTEVPTTTAGIQTSESPRTHKHVYTRPSKSENPTLWAEVGVTTDGPTSRSKEVNTNGPTDRQRDGPVYRHTGTLEPDVTTVELEQTTISPNGTTAGLLPEAPSSCPVIIHIPHAHIETEHRPTGVVVHIVCDPGWAFPEKTTTRTTTPNSYWDTAQRAKELGCHAITCPIPPRRPNTSCSWHGRLVSNTAMYRCHPGYQFADGELNRTTECLTDGTWGYVPHDGCVVMHCPVIQFGVTATVNSTLTAFGTAVTMHCRHGYTGCDVISVCGVSGKWVPPIQGCEPEDTYIEAVVVSWVPAEAEGAQALGGTVLGCLSAVLSAFLALDVLYFVQKNKA